MIADTDAPKTGGRNRFVYMTAALAAFNGLLFGFDTGIISGVFLYIRDASTMTPLVEGIVVSGVLVGAALGAALGGYLAGRWDRGRLILVSAAVLFASSLVMAIAPTVEVLVVGRLIDGVATGFASIVGPLYPFEIAPSKIRGSLVSLNQLAVIVGTPSSYFVNYVFADGGQWRWMLGTGMVLAVIPAVGMVFVPESPRWLAEHDRGSKARDVLSQTHIDDQIRAEFVETNETIEAEDGGLPDLLKPWMCPAFVVGVGPAVLQQVTGINTVTYHVPTIPEPTGSESPTSILATVGIGVVNIVMTVAAAVLIDRRGRRPLLSVGFAGMTLTLIAFGTAFYLPGFLGLVDTVAIGNLMLYVAFFVVGLGPMFWLLISETCPLKVCGTVMGVVAVFNWVANLAVPPIFPAMVVEITTVGTFWMFATLGAAALAFTYRFVPGTKGRLLEAIESDLWENVLGGLPDGSSVGTASDDD